MKKIIFYALVAGIIYYLLTTYRKGTEQATKEEKDLQEKAADQKQKNTEMEQLANAVYTTLRNWWSPPELSILDKASRLSVEDFRIFNQYFNNLWPQGIIHLIDKQGQSFTNKNAKKKGRYDVYMRLKNLVAQV